MQKKDWELLCSLRQYGSLTKVSEVLFITQPALTRRIRSIEQEFNVIITERCGKGIALTEQGRLLADYSAEMLERLGKLQAELTGSETAAGKLHIAATQSITQLLLPGLLEDFRKLYPGVHFEVDTMLSTQAAEALSENRVQLSFFSGKHPGPFDTYPLYNCQAYAVSRNSLTVDELPMLPRITFTADTVSRNLLDEWWYSRFNTAPYIAMHVKNAAIASEMICHGFGYAIFFNRGYWAGRPNLQACPLESQNGTPVSRTDYVASHSAAGHSRLTNIFISFAQHYVKQHIITAGAAEI